MGTYHSAHPLDPFFMELKFGCTPIKTFSEMTPEEGKEVVLGGLVIDFAQRPSRKGGFYGILTLQDYSGSHEFMLFGEDFANYHKYGVVGTPVFVRGTFGRRFRSSTEIRFQINSMSLLDNLKGEAIKGITINLDTDNINEALKGVLVEHISSSQESLGNMRFRLTDTKSNRSVNLDSPMRIPINKELIDKLDNMEIAYTVDRS